MTHKHPMLRWFTYAHLPPFLQKTSKPFCGLAEFVVETTTPGAEQSTALRKLLEGKDAAVRARLEGVGVGKAAAEEREGESE